MVVSLKEQEERLTDILRPINRVSGRIRTVEGDGMGHWRLLDVDGQPVIADGTGWYAYPEMLARLTFAEIVVKGG